MFLQVSITNEDYNCLEAEQFLNDVIIDFYLKYLQVRLLSLLLPPTSTPAFYIFLPPD